MFLVVNWMPISTEIVKSIQIFFLRWINHLAITFDLLKLCSRGIYRQTQVGLTETEFTFVTKSYCFNRACQPHFASNSKTHLIRNCFEF